MRYYEERYKSQFDTETEWLARNAIERVDSIQQLLKARALSPRRVVELGCGPGALLQELKKRQIGESYIGIDYSEEAIAYLRDNLKYVKAIRGDLTGDDFVPDGAFDLIILVHVLQHLPEPAKCIESIAKKMSFSHLVVEVPLEDSFLSRLLRHLPGLKVSSSRDFRQSFGLKSFQQLLASQGLSVVAEKRYAPVYGLQTLRVQRKRQGWSRIKYLQKLITSYFIPKYLGPIKMHLHYSHYVALYEKVAVN